MAETALLATAAVVAAVVLMLVCLSCTKCGRRRCTSFRYAGQILMRLGPTAIPVVVVFLFACPKRETASPAVECLECSRTLTCSDQMFC